MLKYNVFDDYKKAGWATCMTPL